MDSEQDRKTKPQKVQGITRLRFFKTMNNGAAPAAAFIFDPIGQCH